MAQFNDAVPPRNLRRIMLRNSIAASLGSWAIKLLNFAFIIFVVRTLGEAGLGRYATVVAFVGLFSVFFELGMSQFTERDIARNPERARELFWNLVVLRFMLAFAGVGIVTAIGIAAGYDRIIVLGIFLFSLTFLLAAFQTPLTTLLTANERFDLSVSLQVVGQLVTIGLGFVLLTLGYGFIGLLLTGFVAMPVQIVLTVIAIRRNGLAKFPVSITPRSWRAFVLASLPFGLTSLALTFNFNVDTVILGLFHSEATVGWYNASYRLIFNVVGLAGGFLLVMTPSLAREHALDPDRVRRWIESGLRWMIALAVPAGIGLAMLSDRVIDVLYGPEFLPAATALAILAFDVPLMLLNSFFGNVTAATGLEKPAAGIYLGSAGLNVVLNLLLIPTFGIIAAASVTIATDFLSLVVFVVLLRSRLTSPTNWLGVPQVAIACGLMAAGIWLTRDLALPGVILVGGIIYLAAALRLGAIDLGPIARALRASVSRKSAVPS